MKKENFVKPYALENLTGSSSNFHSRPIISTLYWKLT